MRKDFKQASKRAIALAKAIFPTKEVPENEKNIITRVEFIGPEGREFVKWLPEGYEAVVMYQDDGRTLKIFQQGREFN